MVLSMLKAIKRPLQAFFFFLAVLGSANAELLTDSQLSFGKIAVTDNSTVSSVQMSRSGRSSSTNNIYVLELGTPGAYTFTELPPYTMINLTADVPAYSSSTIPGTQQFILRSVDIPSSIKAGPAGMAQFTMGGVLETSGVGGTYISPASYTVVLAINISY
tara:strand:- start:250 stop:732 length:483 start_codon:yes stop_codon:yes gene_type:complete